MKITFKHVILASITFSVVWYLTVGLLDYSVLKTVEKIETIEKEKQAEQYLNSAEYKAVLELEKQNEIIRKELEEKLKEYNNDLN